MPAAQGMKLEGSLMNVRQLMQIHTLPCATRSWRSNGFTGQSVHMALMLWASGSRTEPGRQTRTLWKGCLHRVTSVAGVSVEIKQMLESPWV